MPSDEDLFINDDLENSLENRLNHVLFGLFLSDHYRREVLRCLGETEDAVIYKPCNLPGGGGRPDFAIESLDGRITGYIEVELDKNPEQLAQYRARTNVSVFSFGRNAEDHDVTLEKLIEIGWDSTKADPSPQLKLMVRHLTKQVSESQNYTHPGPVTDQLDTPLGMKLREAGMVNWGEEPVGPGKLLGRANGRYGISVRVFSDKAQDRTVSAFNLTGGRPVARFANYEHLSDYLPDRIPALDAWAAFIEKTLGGSIRNLGTRQYCVVDLPLVEAHLSELVEALLPLR